MKKTVMAVGMSAILMSVAPAFAMQSDTLVDFKALEGIAKSTPMNDKELAAVEGAAPLFTTGQIGLVNASVNANIRDVRVIRDITVRNTQVQILGANQRQ
jgi:hypothetical protein